MRVFSIISCISVCLLIAGCGGGSGGSGGSGSSSRGARIFHASIDDAPLSMVSSLQPAQTLQRMRFAESGGYVELDGGAQTLSFSGGLISNISTPVISVSGDDKRSILFYRDVHSGEAQLAVLEDNPPELDAEAAIRFVHGLPGAAQIEITLASGNKAEVYYGGSSEYMKVSAGSVSYSISRVVDGYRILRGSQTLEAGKSYSVLISGDMSYSIVSTLYEG